MERLNEDQLNKLKCKLPSGYVRLIASRYEKQFGLRKNGKQIQHSSIYRGLTIKNYSEKIVSIALEILIERSGTHTKGVELLSNDHEG